MVTDTTNVQDLRQFVCWRYEERDGKLTKVPYSPLTGKRASSTNPATWARYTEAAAAYRKDGYDGVGLVFTKDDYFCGVDLDGCRDPETGEIEPWAQEIVQEFNSYTEISFRNWSSYPRERRAARRTQPQRQDRDVRSWALLHRHRPTP